MRIFEVVGDLHQDRDPRGAVVGPEERQPAVGEDRVLVGERPGVVVDANHHAIKPIGEP